MNDFELLELYFKRDERAIEGTAESYGAYCFKVAFVLLGNWPDAEECVNDTLERAWSSIPPERPEHLKAYLAKITRRLALDKLERSGRQKRGDAEAVLDELAEVLPSSADTAGEAETRELGRAVNGFIRSLPARDGDIFVRRCFYAEPVRSIARSYGLTEKYAANVLSRTRKKLRKYLIKEGYIDE